MADIDYDELSGTLGEMLTHVKQLYEIDDLSTAESLQLTTQLLQSKSQLCIASEVAELRKILDWPQRYVTGMTEPTGPPGA